jgi:hypothetical protein
MSEYTAVVCTPQGTKVAFETAYASARALIADGKRVRISVAWDTDDVSTRQRRFFHGPVLTQIAEQVRVAGARYTAGVWKEHLRELFLPDVWKDGKPFRVSTEDLGVVGYSAHIERVIAHAAVEWGVVFEFDEQERAALRQMETA